MLPELALVVLSSTASLEGPALRLYRELEDEGKARESCQAELRGCQRDLSKTRIQARMVPAPERVQVLPPVLAVGIGLTAAGLGFAGGGAVGGDASVARIGLTTAAVGAVLIGVWGLLQ